MATYFDTVSRSYEQVTVDEKGIYTLQFLEATDGLIRLFDLLGSSAFSVVQNDMNGNVKKIKTRYDVDPESNVTLECLVVNEKGEKKRTATEGLLWLKRGLEFTAVALRNSMNNPEEELSISFTNSYGVTLKRHHGILIRPVFNLAMKATPYRVDFFKKLGDDQALVKEKLLTWLMALEVLVARLNNFYVSEGYEK